VRIRVIFIAVCIVLIAASLGAVLYLRLGFSGADSALVALVVLIAAAICNEVVARKRDRAEMSNQLSELSRGSGDLARQLAQFGRRLGAMEGKVETVLDKALATTEPLAREVEELSRLVKQLADLVTAHDVVLARHRDDDHGTPHAVVTAPAVTIASAKPANPTAAPAVGKIAAFSGLDRDAIIAAVRGAIEGGTIDLHLQPIVTLPQRKVRYYEAMSRLNAENGEIVATGDFLPYAEAASLVPKLDSLAVLRCVQVVRRLLLKNRDIGVFCNLSGATLTDAGFPQLLELVEANRAIAPSLIFEFTQSAVRTMGPAERAGLAALAGRGFRFSMDNLSDLRIEPRELTERGSASSRHRRHCRSTGPAPLRPTSNPPNFPTCSAASASISSPSGSRANPSWSISWTTMSASGRDFCFRRHARCVRMRCKALPATPLLPRQAATSPHSFTPAADATDPPISLHAHSTR
jgi:cyclic-di-GMP phosphodiesterase, flagellum assembly factor TipF